MKKEKKTSKALPSSTFYVFLCLIAFVLGVLIQNKYNLGEIISHSFVSQESMQRQKLKKILTLEDVPGWSNFQVQTETDHSTYKEQLIRFIGQDNQDELTAYLLIPKSAASQKLPAALCLHGHHSTKEDVAGITPSRYNITYGQTLVKANYIVLIPEIRYSQDIRQIEDPMGLNLLLYGKSLTGERLRDLLRCVTFLTQHEQVDSKRIGIVGWSMGGGLALYLAAIDERINLAYISCYFGTYEGTIMTVRQSTDNYIPGIKNFGELYDVAALIAPRPLLIEHGIPDREFPVEIAKMAFEHVKHDYAQKGAMEKLKMVIREGGHKFYGDEMIPWFNQFLSVQ